LDLTSGELAVREAVAARLIKVTGDRSLYDTEDIMKLLEELQRNLVRAINR